MLSSKKPNYRTGRGVIPIPNPSALGRLALAIKAPSRANGPLMNEPSLSRFSESEDEGDGYLDVLATDSAKGRYALRRDRDIDSPSSRAPLAAKAVLSSSLKEQIVPALVRRKTLGGQQLIESAYFDEADVPAPQQPSPVSRPVPASPTAAATTDIEHSPSSRPRNIATTPRTLMEPAPRLRRKLTDATLHLDVSVPIELVVSPPAQVVSSVGVNPLPIEDPLTVDLDRISEVSESVLMTTRSSSTISHYSLFSIHSQGLYQDPAPTTPAHSVPSSSMSNASSSSTALPPTVFGNNSVSRTNSVKAQPEQPRKRGLFSSILDRFSRRTVSKE